MEKRIVGVVSGKGGVGKTTIAINLGILASRAGERTLVVDADVGNPAVGLHLGQWQYSHGLQDVAKKKVWLQDAVVTHPPSGLRFLPATFSYASEIHIGNLKGIFEKAPFDTIIIDTPPGFSNYISDIMSLCTEILLVATPSVPSVTSITRLADMSKKSNVKNRGIVINRVTNKPHEMHQKEVERICETRISGVVPEDPAVPESISAKIPLVLYKPHCIASLALADLATYTLNLKGTQKVWGMETLSRLLSALRSIFRI